MSAVGRLRLDLRHGRNLDLYIAVAVAVVIAVLGVAGAVDPKVLAAATLAVLAVMATSGLASRHQVDDVRTTLERLAANESGKVAADRFLARRLPALDTEIVTATDIALVGVTLSRTVRDLLPALDRRLRSGARVRVLLIDTDSQANVEAFSRSRKADPDNFYGHRVASTVALLRVLATSAASAATLQLRMLPFVPTFGLCIVDGDEGHGRIHVEIYQHRTLEPNPSFSLHADRDGYWYGLFRGQFETLWECGRPLTLTQDGHATS